MLKKIVQISSLAALIALSAGLPAGASEEDAAAPAGSFTSDMAIPARVGHHHFFHFGRAHARWEASHRFG
ncbi:MAG TPA: hypothetical protein VN685_04260 [Rhizomicrobium sp.]|nr:hypothetical protein [Rhizomicrobium sp.]